MVLKYVAVFDPSRSTNEDDTHRQLLLYHSFTDAETTLQDKLSRIGIIQGIWTLTDSLNDGEKSCEKAIELDDGVILAIKVESKFFICLSIAKNREETNETMASIPHQLYMTQIWYCYYFFTLHYGKLQYIEDPRKLTAMLNEHFVSFWNDIVLRPEVIIRRGITGLWPQSYKVAELEFDSEGESWESMINQNILLESESYLGIKDILVYHLPSQNTFQNSKKEKKLGYKTYGLVRHFSADLEITNELSNWIYHTHAVYDVLSSHILAGTTHYKEGPEQEARPQQFSNDSSAIEQESTMEPLTKANFQTNLQEHGKMLLHNLALPITFTYDALQEVSSTAGISSSMSLFRDYVPRWGNNKNGDSFEEDVNSQHPKARYGFLISPLCSPMLPMSYKAKTVKYYDKDSDATKDYRLLFWYYDDVLVVVVSESNFSKIWDSQYLQDLSYKLRLSMECFYKTAFRYPKSKEKKAKKESFAYTILNKESKIIRSSIPSAYTTHPQDDGIFPVKLVVNGVDQLFGTTNAADYENSGIGKWGIDIMGGIFGLKSANKTKELGDKELTNSIERSYESFFDGLQQEKKWELHLQILAFLESLKNSQITKNIFEERLLKLNNGILCYVKETEEQLVIIVKNWYENEESYKNARTLFQSLGTDVCNWWSALSQS